MSLRVDGPVKLFAMIQVFFQHSLTDDSTRLEVIESDATLCPRLVTQTIPKQKSGVRAMLEPSGIFDFRLSMITLII